MMTPLEIPSANPAALGTLSKLPSEIRILIWHLLIPKFRKVKLPKEGNARIISKYGDSSETSRPAPKKVFPLLLTNRAVSEEFATELYQKRILCISIDPKHDGLNYGNMNGKEVADLSRFKQLRLQLHPPKMQYRQPKNQVRHSITRLHLDRLRNYAGDIEREFRYTSFRNQPAKERGTGLGVQDSPKIELTFVDDKISSWWLGGLADIDEQSCREQLPEWLHDYEIRYGIKYIVFFQGPILPPGARDFLKTKFGGTEVI